MMYCCVHHEQASRHEKCARKDRLVSCKNAALFVQVGPTYVKPTMILNNWLKQEENVEIWVNESHAGRKNTDRILYSVTEW